MKKRIAESAKPAAVRASPILRDQSTAVFGSISLAEGAGWEQRLGSDNGAGGVPGA